MSGHDAWLSTTGAHHHSRQNDHGLPRSPYERTYRDRLSEPSILVSVIVLVLSVLYSTNIISIPSTLGNRLWNLLVAVIPAFLIFAVDDWLRPFPLPRQPLSRLSPAAARQEKSNALSRILGRDSGGRGGVFSSVSYASKTGFSRLMAKGSIDRPAGLGNMSYSCYQNSILQSLSSLSPLRDYLAWIADEEEAGGLPHLQTARTLGKLIDDLYSPGQNGETLWTPPDLKRMSTFQQQDAQEYFCKLLNEVQEEVEKALKAVQTYPGFETGLDGSSALHTNSPPQALPVLDRTGLGNRGNDDGSANNDPRTISSPFSEDSGYHSNASSTSSARRATSVANCFRIPLEGLVAQRIVCQSCGYSSGLSMNPFYCLTLNLGVGVHEQRLEDALDSFSAVENIEGVQCACCTLLKFRGRIRTIISNIEAESGEGCEATRLKQPVPYERLKAIETALFEDDFEEKTIAETCKIPAKQRVESTKSRQVGIARAPPSIAFHINRSRFDETTGYTFKNPAAVRFPLRLDLGPWCLGSATSHTTVSSGGDGASQNHEASFLDAGTSSDTQDKEPAQRDVIQDRKCDEQDEEEKPAAPSEAGQDDQYGQEEQWQLPAQQPMVSGTKNVSRITGPLYELRAVITHYGQHENGHYICYRKHPVPPRPPPNDEVKKCTSEMEETVDYLASEKTRCETSDPQHAQHDSQEAVTQVGEPTNAVQDTISEDGASDRTAETDNASQKPEQENETDKDYGAEEEAGPHWWRLSDQNVSRSDEQTVLAQGGVFMLFYDRIDARSVFRSLDTAQSSTAGSDTGEASSVSEETSVVSSDNTSLYGSENPADATNSTPLRDQSKTENSSRADEDVACESAADQGSVDRAPEDKPVTYGESVGAGTESQLPMDPGQKRGSLAVLLP